jgi:hypothetical protein
VCVAACLWSSDSRARAGAEEGAKYEEIRIDNFLSSS